jgi:predicted trehalose synthase
MSKMGLENLSGMCVIIKTVWIMQNRNAAAVICALCLLSAAYAQPLNSDITNIKNPKLESVLSELIRSDDLQAFAGAHDLYLKDGRIRVVVEISDKAALLPNYVMEETRYEKTVQIMVPIDKIVSLSSQANVTFIRTPSKPHVDTIAATQTPAQSSGSSTVILLISSIILILLIRKKRSGSL